MEKPVIQNPYGNPNYKARVKQGKCPAIHMKTLDWCQFRVHSDSKMHLSTDGETSWPDILNYPTLDEIKV
jgi:hypothetical protein